MSKLKNIHPGEVLLEEFLIPLEISQNQLARDMNVSPRRINEIVLEKRSITADTDLRLSRALGTSEGFWLGLQADYDLEERRREIILQLPKIHNLAVNYKAQIPPKRNHLALKVSEPTAKYIVSSNKKNVKSIATKKKGGDRISLASSKTKIRFGVLKDKIKIADDFDAPLPDHIIDDFEK